MVITVHLKAIWKAGKKMPGFVISSPCQIPAQVDIARVQRLLHSGTLSVIQHKITFSVTIWVVLKHPALQYCVTVDTLSRCLLRNVTAVR